MKTSWVDSGKDPNSDPSAVDVRDVVAFDGLSIVQRRALATKTANNATRLRTLAVKAAKYARDPGSNPQLTAREINEFLARLALAEAADDQ